MLFGNTFNIREQMNFITVAQKLNQGGIPQRGCSPL